MQTQARVKAVLEEQADGDGETSTLAIELDAIPGAVWQMELGSLLPPNVRVTLFQRGEQKCALLRFPSDQREHAFEAFELALRGANAVSHETHLGVRAALEAR